MRRKGPLPGKIFARCIPERRFAGLFEYTARISCQSQLVLDTWRRYVAREGRFSRPGPLRGCMKRKTCRGWPPGNAFREHLAIAELPRAHRRHTLPWRRSLGQHITDMSCHAWPLRTNRACISPAKPRSGCGGRSMLAPASPDAGAAAGVRGRGMRTSTADNTGCGANCAARALMNPFTPTFPRYGAVIEINCYVTNN